MAAAAAAAAAAGSGAAAPALVLESKRHHEASWVKTTASTARHPLACTEDHIRDSVFNQELKETHGAYAAREPRERSASWRKQLLAGARDIRGLHVAPDAVNYSTRLRRQVITFKARIEPDTGVGTVTLPPEACAKVFLTGCKVCAHSIVPLTIEVIEYHTDVGGVELQMQSSWPDFVNDAAIANGNDPKKPALPRDWFGVQSYEIVSGGSEVRGVGPQIGSVRSADDMRAHPMLCFHADERFACAENFDTLAKLVELRRMPATRSMLKRLGAIDHPNQVGYMLLKHPHEKTNLAPNLLSMKYTESFAMRFNGASQSAITEHSCEINGVQTSEKTANTNWLCQTAHLHGIVESVREEFTSVPLIMDFEKGLTVTMCAQKVGAAAAATPAAGAVGGSAVSVTFQIVYIVV